VFPKTDGDSIALYIRRDLKRCVFSLFPPMEEEERRDDSAIFSLRKKEKRHARTTAHLELEKRGVGI